MPTRKTKRARLALETGQVYVGTSFGSRRDAEGEVVFNTGTTGYVEVLTDPSYHRQIVVMTQPHIGNYGVQPDDFEWHRPAVAGFCVQDLTPTPRHPESRFSLDVFLSRNGVPAVAGLPTRELTLLLRRRGSVRGLLTTQPGSDAALVERARRLPSMRGAALAGEVTAPRPYVWGGGAWAGRRRVAVLDLGVKRSLLRQLQERGCSVKVFPAQVPPKALLRDEPDALVLSSGPGDPAALGTLIRNVGELLVAGRPLLGICLGHQLLALAAGARTAKLKFGHHGVNHPVREEGTGRVLVTTQNHGFAVKPDSLPRDYIPTHRSLNDGTLEGFRHRRRPWFAYQFHPEAGPGPLEPRELLGEFLASV